MTTKLIFALLMTLMCQLTFGQSMTLALEGDEWKDVQAYPVKGKKNILSKESMTFGDYKTVEVDRSWTKGTQVTTGLTSGIPTDEFYTKIITTDKIHKKQSLYFSLQDKTGLQSQAYCATQLDAKDFNIGNSPVSALNLLLDLAGPGVSATNISFAKIYDGVSGDGWELMIDNEAAQAKPKSYIGYLAKNNDEFYTVVPTSKVKSKKGKTGTMPFGSAGFEIRAKDGRAVAAVSIIDNGVIYLADSNPQEQMLLATACAALLLRPADL